MGPGQREQQLQRRARAAPDSSRDSVLTEMPVAADRSASVISRCWRSARSRGPTAASVRSSRRPWPSVCHIGNDSLPICAVRPHGRRRRSIDSDERHGRAYDVVVVGGGAAGLSGALMLARSRRSVLVIDAGAPRNAPAEGVHGLLAPRRDRRRPSCWSSAGRRSRGYGGEVVTGRGRRAVGRDGDGFAVTLADGRSRVAPAGCWSPPGWSTSCPTCPGCASAGAATCCTARTATAGRSATRRSACWRPGRWRCTRRCCSGS